jgi:hypothetical protein
MEHLAVELKELLKSVAQPHTLLTIVSKTG